MLYVTALYIFIKGYRQGSVLVGTHIISSYIVQKVVMVMSSRAKAAGEQRLLLSSNDVKQLYPNVRLVNSGNITKLTCLHFACNEYSFCLQKLVKT